MNIFFDSNRNFGAHIILLAVLANCAENKNSDYNADNQNDSTYVSISEQQSSGFSIQVAALRDKNNADNLSNILRKSELPAYVLSDSTSPGDLFFKIRIGPYHTEYQASRALKNINELGYEKAFITTEGLAIVDSVEADLNEQPRKIELTHSGQSSHPQWSPKGREIAFFKKENGARAFAPSVPGEGIYQKSSKVKKNASSQQNSPGRHLLKKLLSPQSRSTKIGIEWRAYF